MTRLLMQIAFACNGPGRDEAVAEDHSDPVAEIITSLGGQIEHRWKSDGEFDAVLVVRIVTGAVLPGRFDMVAAAHPSTKATRTATIIAPEDAIGGDGFDDIDVGLNPQRSRELVDELSRAGISIVEPLTLGLGTRSEDASE